jgi:hypothetical protein
VACSRRNRGCRWLLPHWIEQRETAPLSAPFLVLALRVDRPTLLGAGGSDPLGHCWRGNACSRSIEHCAPEQLRAFDLSQLFTARHRANLPAKRVHKNEAAAASEVAGAAAADSVTSGGPMIGGLGGLLRILGSVPLVLSPTT